MLEIKKFLFKRDNFQSIKKHKFGQNWPVVYIIEDGKRAYVGETTHLYSRSKQHYDGNSERRTLGNIHLISDEEYNKSATLDIEAWLIQYLAAEGSFTLLNGNGGLQNHNYYDREKYKAKFKIIWEELKKLSLVKRDLVQIQNSNLFKYSPYKSLSEDQLIVAEQIVGSIEMAVENTHVINGAPGTGKSILAIYLVKYLKENERTKHLKVGLVVPMTSLRATIKRVFANIHGLSSSMVIGPNDVVKQKYDILIADEAHRLKQRKNIANYGSFDQTNKKLQMDNTGTELDWILKSSKIQILFYDERQRVRPADIPLEKITKLNGRHYTLSSQLRVEAGDEYINFVEDLFNLKNVDKYKFPNYDLRFYEDINHFIKDIKQRDKEEGLSRIVAGLAWEWKKDPNIHDIEIEGTKLVWNSTNTDWVNSKNAVNEVGCIHTIQGYDLNYVGVIIGPELSYDDENKKIIVKSDNYTDANGWKGVTNEHELEQYILNIYKTLLTRGIKGTYIYVVDKKLEKYFKSILEKIIND